MVPSARVDSPVRDPDSRVKHDPWPRSNLLFQSFSTSRQSPTWRIYMGSLESGDHATLFSTRRTRPTRPLNQRPARGKRAGTLPRSWDPLANVLPYAVFRSKLDELLWPSLRPSAADRHRLERKRLLSLVTGQPKGVSNYLSSCRGLRRSTRCADGVTTYAQLYVRLMML